MGYCTKNPDQDDDSCCLHDLPMGHRDYPGRVCCWCGDLFQPHSDSRRHGPYEPGSILGQTKFDVGDFVYWCPNTTNPRPGLTPGNGYFVAAIAHWQSGAQYALSDEPTDEPLGAAPEVELTRLPRSDKE